MASTGFIIFVSIFLFAAHFFAKLAIWLSFNKGFRDRFWMYGSNVTHITYSIFPIYYIWIGLEIVIWLYKTLVY
jgi:hypothetical protein